MFNTPFPRPFYRTYLLAALITGFCICFILNVFQPFNTQNFQHEYKFWILSGYGIIAAISIAFYYGTSFLIFNKNRVAKWTIVHESADLLAAMIFSMVMCYLYYAYVFQRSITWPRMLDFLQIAFSVSLLPVAGLFGYIFYRYRGIQRSSLNIEPVHKSSNLTQITLKGTNKNEEITAQLDELLFIKAEDNYVILYLLKDENVQMHMIRSTLKQIETQINSAQFFKGHRSYIINLNQISQLSGNKNSTKAKMKYGNKEIPISRSKVDEIRAAFSKNQED